MKIVKETEKTTPLNNVPPGGTVFEWGGGVYLKLSLTRQYDNEYQFNVVDLKTGELANLDQSIMVVERLNAKVVI